MCGVLVRPAFGRKKPVGAPAPSVAPTPAAPSAELQAAARANERDTAILAVVMLLTLYAVGYCLGWLGQVLIEGRDPLSVSPWGVFTGAGLFVLGFAWTVFALQAGGSVILGLGGARFVTSLDEPLLHAVTAELAAAAGVEKPKTAVIEVEALNAFTFGTSADKAVMVVTRGLLRSLDPEELQGVAAHQIARLARQDVQYATVLAVLPGLPLILSDLVQRGLGGAADGGGRRRRSLASLVLMAGAILLGMIAPLGLLFLRLAVSREQALRADAVAVRLTGDPQGLIRALTRLVEHRQPFTGASKALQHMYMVDPFRDADEALRLNRLRPPD